MLVQIAIEVNNNKVVNNNNSLKPNLSKSKNITNLSKAKVLNQTF